MKNVKVEWQQHRKPKDRYPSRNLNFCWLAPDGAGGFTQVSGWHTCRETFTGVVRLRISTPPTGDLANIYLKGTCFAVVQKRACRSEKEIEEFKKQEEITELGAAAVLKFLNIIESKFGWGLSRIYKHCSKDISANGCIVYIFRGSVKWLRSPQTLSMYLLFSRLILLPELFANVKSFDDVKATLSTPLPKLAPRGSRLGPDVGVFKTVIRNLDLIMGNANRLFFKRTITQHFKENYQNWGISSLLARNTIASRHIVDTLNKIKKENKKK